MQSTARVTEDKIQDDARNVADDFDALRADVSRLAENVRKLAANELGTSVEDLQAKAGEQITAAERAIRRNPTQAALLAAGIGFLAGLVIIR